MLKTVHSGLLETIQGLYDMLKAQAELYYQDDNATITDAEYDQLCVHLRRMVTLHGLNPLDFPLAFDNHVGYGEVLRQGDVRHLAPMYSLKKLYDADDVFKFVQSSVRAIQALDSDTSNIDLTMNVEYKLDGHAIELVYIYGKLCGAVTRGNGLIGKSVISQMYAVPGVPLSLSDDEAVCKQLKVVAIDGELYADKEGWEAWLMDPNCNPLNPPADPRAMISMVRRNESVGIEKYLRFNPHNISYIQHAEGFDYGDLDIHGYASSQHQLLLNWGFTRVTPITRLSGDIVKLSEAIVVDVADKRKALGFPIDGIVVSYDSLEVRQLLKYTQAAPRWAFALKFPAEDHHVQIRSVEWTVAMNGDLVPTLRHSPIKIGGREFKVVSLHNFSYFKTLGALCSGQPATIAIKGDVTPILTGVSTSADVDERLLLVHPKTCPCCSTSLVVSKTELKCVNHQCLDQIAKRLVYYANKTQMKGFDVSKFKHLAKELNITCIGELYVLLTKNDVPMLSPVGVDGKTWSKLSSELKLALRRDFITIIVAISYGQLKPSDIKAIEATFSNFDELVKHYDEPLPALPESANHWLNANCMTIIRLRMAINKWQTGVNRAE